jgi:hypothetical protein
MASDRRGPFDRILNSTTTAPAGAPEHRDRSAVYIGGAIIGLAILLLVLVLPPISILSGGGGDGGEDVPSGPGNADTYTSSIRSGVPKLPAGLAAASSLFDLAAPEDQRGASGITVPLKESLSDARDLALYTYVDNKWQRLSDVSLVAGGSAVRGEVGSLPGNVIVLRRSATVLQVAGAIPAGTTIDPGAEGVLTTLHPIVFIPADDGSIAGVPPAVPPASYRVVPGIVAPVPEVVDNIWRSTELRTAHATAIADAVKQGNYAGIIVDYRNTNETLREQYTQFIEQLATALHEDGRTLSVMLPLPRSDGGEMQTGAFDWEALGGLVDSIEVQAEPDQELYFQRTEAALDYIVEKVDRGKILLTVTTLSVERGGDGLRTMSFNGAMSLASQISVAGEGDIAPNAQVGLIAHNLAQSEGASGLYWDDAARSVTYTYPGLGGKRTVWVANAFSVRFRLELAQRYNLGGVAFNDVSVEGGGADVWPAVQEVADTGSVTLSKPNGELFLPQWSANEGTISPATGDAVTWTSPADAGTYEITIIVSDGVDRLSQRATLNVVPAPSSEGE